MKNLFFTSLETLFNRYLSLDPESVRRLSQLEGKIITIELTGLSLSFQLKILDNHIRIQEVVQTEHVLIKGSPLCLLQASLLKENRKKLFAEDVKIEGELELGQQIIDLFDELDIDWEEHLSHAVGDVAAHQIGNMARRLKRFSQKTRDTIKQSINEYVHEEVDLFPPREALQDFFQEVDILRMDVDRLEEHVKRMKHEERP